MFPLLLNQHYGMGPAPETKPSLQDVMGLWNMMSPEHDTQLALMQHKLGQSQNEDQFAHQFGGAPSMDAARLFQTSQEHAENVPFKTEQIARLKDMGAERNAENQFAQSQGYDNFPIYKLESQRRDQELARQGLQDQREAMNDQRGESAKLAKFRFLSENPMLFMQQTPGHPLPPHIARLQQLAAEMYPDSFQNTTPGVDPALKAKLLNSTK